MKKVSEYFKSYPGSKKCYQTSDGFIFHQEGDAMLHARSLGDDTVAGHKKVVEIANDAKVDKPAKKEK